MSQVEAEHWVRDFLFAARQPGMVVDVLAAAPHPHRPFVACQVRIENATGDPDHGIAVVDLVTGACHRLDLDVAAVRTPTWSRDGTRLALMVTADGLDTVWVLAAESGDWPNATVVARLADAIEVVGAVEALAWSADGRLALVVAQVGAEVSDVYGSGTVGAASSVDTWRPDVSPRPESGRRIAHVWDLDAGDVSLRSPELNVWELDWLGDELIVLGTEGAGEGAWYGASLSLLDAGAGRHVLHTPRAQLAQPRGAPGGGRWSVLSGPASDRGLLAGQLIMGTSTGQTVAADTRGVDVTDHRWIDDDQVLIAGLRGLRTVFGVVDSHTGALTELLDTDGTSGLHQPELGGLSANGDLIVVLEQHARPPALSRIEPGGEPVALLSTTGPGSDHLVAQTGRSRPFVWSSSDGLEIEGVLTVPNGDGPYPTVLNVHGGPVAAWRDGWIGKDLYTAVLVARGFAVLRPNPRGSVGRGAAFVEHVQGDMGGRDSDDLITAVAALVDAGVAIAGRVGITGNSYGGYMAAWVPCLSEVFAAAVSRSPVTDWRSQHLSSNLTEFDELFVGGDPFDNDSRYATRSPVLRWRDVRTPMLLTAGARDLATPAAQAVHMHRVLLRGGVATELAVYPEEGHGVRNREALSDQLARMIRWFETYL